MTLVEKWLELVSEGYKLEIHHNYPGTDILITIYGHRKPYDYQECQWTIDIPRISRLIYNWQLKETDYSKEEFIVKIIEEMMKELGEE